MPRRKGVSIPPSGRQLEGLKPWKPGVTGNAGGRPKSHKEAVAMVRAEMDMIIGGMLGIARKHASGEPLSHSDKIASNHFEFLVQFAFGRHAQSMMLTAGLDVGDNPSDADTGVTAITALLRVARSEALPTPPPSRADAAPDPRLTPDEMAMFTPAAVMLARTRADKPDGTSGTAQKVLENLGIAPERAAELIGKRRG